MLGDMVLVMVQIDLPFTTGALTDSSPQWTQKL